MNIHQVKLPFILIVLSLLISCKSDSEDVKRLFYSIENTVAKSVRPLVTENNILSYPTAICALDSVVIVLDESSDLWFHAFDKTTGEHLSSFGNKIGENKIMNPFTLCQQVHDSLIILDGNRLITVNANYADLVQNKVSLNISSLPESLPIYNDLFLGRKDEFIGTTLFSDRVYFRHNRNDSLYVEGKGRPETGVIYDKSTAGMVYQGRSDIDKDFLLYNAYLLFNRVDIFNLDGGLGSTLIFGDKEETITPKLRDGAPTSSNVQHYMGVKSESNFLFLQYFGREMEELSNTNNEFFHIIDQSNFNGLATAIEVNADIRSYDPDISTGVIYVVYDDGETEFSIGVIEISDIIKN